MKTRTAFAILMLFAATLVSQSQEKANLYSFDFNKLKPIVQVFGTAGFDLKSNQYGYSFGRAHLGFQYRFNEHWSTKIIIDRGRPTSFSDLTVADSMGNSLSVNYSYQEGSYYTFWLKFASLQWTVNEKLTIEGGAILQNHYITQERFWGLRFVSQTFQDLYWKLPSSDLGFIAHYKVSKVVSIDAALTNGEGPRIKQDVFGKVKFAGGIDINPSQNVQTRFYYHNRQSGVDSAGTEQMLSVFAGFKPSDKFRIGGEFNTMKNLNNVTNLDSYGFSFYTAFRFTDKTGLFARYDRLYYQGSDQTIGRVYGGNAIMTGISYSPVNGVNLSLNYQGWLTGEATNQNHDRILLSMEYKF